jgi:DNA-binding GntR family transcriptional regulator
MEDQAGLVERIRQDLAGKEPGERLESERAMAKLYQVSRASVKRAILQLIAEGVLQQPPGHCPRIALPKETQSPLERLLDIEPAVRADLSECVAQLSRARKEQYPASITALLCRLERLSQ